MSHLSWPSMFARRLRRGLLIALGAPTLALATQFGPINATRTYAGSFTGSTAVAGVAVNGGTNKIAYLRFEVSGLRQFNSGIPYPHTLFRRVTKAELKLTLNAAATGKNLQVWSSHNYSGSFTPVATGAVALNTRSMDSALTQVIDVTDYISGEGVFSFVLKTSTGSEIAFNASPVLALTLNDGQGTASAVTIGAEAYEDRGLLVRKRYSDEAGDINDAGIINITKQPYNAIPGDNQDDLLAIQRAVNDAQMARLAVYIPSGVFDLSDTLNCESPVITQGWIERNEPTGSDEFDADWEYSSVQDFPTVIRGVLNGTSTLRRLGTTTFGATGFRKPLIYLWSRHWDPPKSHMNVHASNFNHTLMNVIVEVKDVASGDTTNDNAVGVSIPGSQGVRISEVTVNAGGAYAGVMGMPGPGGIIHGVKVNGGQYGLWSGTNATSESHAAYTSVVSYCVFSGQTEHGIRYGGGGSLTVVGTRLIDNKGIYSDAGIHPWNGPINVIDSSITLRPSSTTAAIQGTRSVYLKNVYVARQSAPSGIAIVSVAAPDTTATTLANAGSITLVNEFAGAVTIDQAPNHTGPATPVGIFVKANDVWMTPPTTTAWSVAAPTSVAAVPAATDVFYTKHNWEPTPNFNGAGVFNAGAGANGVNGTDFGDDWSKLQAMVNANAVVFLPAGTYYLSQPLVLPANHKLFGISKSYTILKPIWDNFGGGALQPLIRTHNSTTDTTLLADIQLRTRITSRTDLNVYQLHWRSGKGTMKDVLFDRRQMYKFKEPPTADLNHPLVLLDTTGGGKWYGFWVNRDFAGPNYRHMKISGTTTPLAFYNFNPEYAQTTGQVEIVNAHNLDFFGVKTEGNYCNFTITGCDKFRIYGLGGNASPWPETLNEPNSYNVFIKGCQDFLIANQAFQQRRRNTAPYYTDDYHTFDGAITDPATYDRLVERTAAGSTIGRTEGTEQFVLYRRGTPFP